MQKKTPKKPKPFKLPDLDIPIAAITNIAGNDHKTLTSLVVYRVTDVNARFDAEKIYEWLRRVLPNNTFEFLHLLFMKGIN